MAELKTKKTDASVEAFLTAIKPAEKQADARAIVALLQRASGEPPTMWGKSIVGFGRYHYVYESGREGDTMLTGFSPRAQNLTLYLMGGLAGQDALLAKLGKHTTGKGCLYLRRFSDVDATVLEKLVRASIKALPKPTAPKAKKAAPPKKKPRKAAASE